MVLMDVVAVAASKEDDSGVVVGNDKVADVVAVVPVSS
jgi:hypothetical protein